MFGDTSEVDSTVHVAWLHRKLTDLDSCLLIAEADGEPVGYVRFDAVDAGKCEVSIAIAPGRRGQGLAQPMLRQGCAEARTGWPARAITARVRLTNEASHRLFVACGFEESGRDDEMIYYSLPLS